MNKKITTAATEWLLIGGPANGKKVTILHDGTVKWAGNNGDDWLYQGQNYLHRGHMYRIGVIDPNDVEPGKVARMIDETGLRPIDGACHEKADSLSIVAVRLCDEVLGK